MEFVLGVIGVIIAILVIHYIYLFFKKLGEAIKHSFIWILAYIIGSIVIIVAIQNPVGQFFATLFAIVFGIIIFISTLGKKAAREAGEQFDRDVAAFFGILKNFAQKVYNSFQHYSRYAISFFLKRNYSSNYSLIAEADNSVLTMQRVTRDELPPEFHNLIENQLVCVDAYLR